MATSLNVAAAVVAERGTTAIAPGVPVPVPVSVPASAAIETPALEVVMKAIRAMRAMTKASEGVSEGVTEGVSEGETAAVNEGVTAAVSGEVTAAVSVGVSVGAAGGVGATDSRLLH